ncbi:MAG: hypothetical protein MI976_11335 [Pseudomonadales bacterium]|nr:hypothetical protein [Pseudomonadales bacterium]
MNLPTEQKVFEHLVALIGRFDQPNIVRKSVEVSPGIEVRFTVLERNGIKTLLLMETIEEKVQVFACKMAVYGYFVRGLTLEQFGVVRREADFSTEAGWAAYMEINAFISDWLAECCQCIRIEALKIRAARRVA